MNYGIDDYLMLSLCFDYQALHYKKYSSASDVWSYGALMYEIWSVGHKPFEDYANNKVSLKEMQEEPCQSKSCQRL